LSWSCAFRSTFRLFPGPGGAQDSLDVFLASDGKTQEQILSSLPYDKARSNAPGSQPDPKRYRDDRQLYRTVGLIYDQPVGDTRRLTVTPLGSAVARWRPVINERNAPVLGRHAAQALAACQLRNPTRDGAKYDPTYTVFPFAFIWRAMLSLEGTISSDELNRSIFKTKNDSDLDDAIATIRKSRASNDVTILGPETVTEAAKNDRILVWMAWASFGWTLIQDKRAAGGVYSISPNAKRVLADAASIHHKHRDFEVERHYVEYLSFCGGLPEDLR
jgi:hypothetical protein